MSCKLPTLTQARKFTKFFANEDCSLPLLATNSYRALHSKVLQCPLCYKSEVTLVNNMYVRLSPVEEHHLVEISSTGSIDRTIVHRALSTKESSRLFSPFSLSSAVLLCFNYIYYCYASFLLSPVVHWCANVVPSMVCSLFLAQKGYLLSVGMATMKTNPHPCPSCFSKKLHRIECYSPACYYYNSFCDTI